MTRLFTRLQSFNVFRVVATFLVGITFFVSSAFLPAQVMQAQAAPMTPEATQYDSNADSNSGLIESIKDAADNVREKLNLDEPLPKSTKQFLDAVQDPDKGLIQDTERSTKEGYKAAAGNSPNTFSIPNAYNSH